MTMHPWMYVVLLGLVFLVYARFLPKAQAEVAKTNVVQEIEETIEHFAAEMDEQNQAILDLFSRTKSDYEVELAKLAGRLESLEKQKSELSHELQNMQIRQQISLQAPAVQTGLPKAEDLPVKLQAVAAAAPSPAVQPEEVRPESAAEVQPQPESFASGMKTRYAELFRLHEQGKGVEIIAKKLGMNKGEVNLILQLARQEERSRV
ncbi:hypothetical protein B5M42_002910 [Paenibacillus athensensis]|uniref:Uncharacterized protein n=1 Tax=Paenibacillus athensensis TaxID=1967502 RepID=A0A4Y8QBV5_9BACL|nr:hypothetical protein [Paenibacillus athensensis]MCD1257791.1 hypothetical protein [Paenibacillus athensensis]